MKPSLSVDIVISSYNYATYIVDAIESALSQDYPVNKILVIDDGSTDNTLSKLEKYHSNEKVLILNKENRGQLSCFNYCLSYVSSDIIFFLDADDLYKSDHISRCVNVYHNVECDFLFCKREYIGKRTGKESTIYHDGAIGYSILRTYFLHRWIGSATSTVSMSITLLKKILPIPFEDDWKVRADDCLIYSASLAAAKKHFLDECLIYYRVHESNNHHSKHYSHDDEYNRKLAILRLFRYELDKNNVVPDIKHLYKTEFLSVLKSTNNNKAILIDYLNVLLLSRESFVTKLYYLTWSVAYWSINRHRMSP